MEEKRYRVIKKLAEGGNGETYLVWDKRLERNWAMKCIVTEDEERRYSMMREIAALRQIHKEGIPVLADVFYEGNTVCLIMEYMEGVSLEQRIKNDGVMEEEEAVRCALQLAELVGFLHAMPEKMVHGDLKPLNLLYHNGKIALLDFGGAVSESERMSGHISGCWYTPGYGAPELLRQCKVSEKSDIFAFGAVLFYLVMGEQPDGNRGIYPVREQNPFLSEELEAMILKCTTADPQERYGSMGEIILELQDITEFPAAVGVKKSRTGKYKRRKKRRNRDTFRCIKNILLTEGKIQERTGKSIARSVLLLCVGVLSLSGKVRGAAGGMAGEIRRSRQNGFPVQASSELLPVSIRTREGELLLVDFSAVYHTEENLMFELPLKCFEKGKEYEVTISQKERKGDTLRQRTFVICAD